jgi:transposase
MDEQDPANGCPGCRRLEARCRDLEARIRALEEQVRLLTATLEEARRAGKRQAAPFRKPKTVEKPKRPGRKRGKDHGEHTHRVAPENASTDEEHEASLPPECPECNSTNIEEYAKTDEQFQTEIICWTVRRRFVIHRGRCVDCGAALEGRHPLQTSTATGAAREQLGATVHTLMSVLNKQLGLSHGKVAWLLEKVFHVKIDRSTSARSVQRTARRCEAAYEQIRRDVRASDQVTPDETGWRVGGQKAWLHAFASPQATCYEVDPTRSGQPAERLLGLDWPGRLVHDGWSVYDRFGEAIHQQCNAHLLNRCNELLEVARRGAVRFPRAVKSLLQKGLATRDRYQQGQLSAHGLRVAAGRLTAELGRLVEGRFTHDGNRRLANFLYQHFDEIFAYLRYSGMDATNYRGEQAIRPAVVNRKVWGGNRTWLGARAQSVLTSVLRTCTQREIDPINFFTRVLTSPTPILIPP